MKKGTGGGDASFSETKGWGVDANFDFVCAVRLWDWDVSDTCWTAVELHDNIITQADSTVWGTILPNIRHYPVNKWFHFCAESEKVSAWVNKTFKCGLWVKGWNRDLTCFRWSAPLHIPCNSSFLKRQVWIFSSFVFFFCGQEERTIGVHQRGLHPSLYEEKINQLPQTAKTYWWPPNLCVWSLRLIV